LNEKEHCESLIFLLENRDGRVKAQTCTSPMAETEAILITGVIEAKQQRDIRTFDILPIPQDGDQAMM